jgi:hypothetical protein
LVSLVLLLSAAVLVVGVMSGGASFLWGVFALVVIGAFAAVRLIAALSRV